VTTWSNLRRLVLDGFKLQAVAVVPAAAPGAVCSSSARLRVEPLSGGLFAGMPRAFCDARLKSPCKPLQSPIEVLAAVGSMHRQTGCAARHVQNRGAALAACTRCAHAPACCCFLAVILGRASWLCFLAGYRGAAKPPPARTVAAARSFHERPRRCPSTRIAMCKPSEPPPAPGAPELAPLQPARCVLCPRPRPAKRKRPRSNARRGQTPAGAPTPRGRQSAARHLHHQGNFVKFWAKTLRAAAVGLNRRQQRACGAGRRGPGGRLCRDRDTRARSLASQDLRCTQRQVVAPQLPPRATQITRVRSPPCRTFTAQNTSIHAPRGCPNHLLPRHLLVSRRGAARTRGSYIR
jgi:hypothetical protein